MKIKTYCGALLVSWVLDTMPPIDNGEAGPDTQTLRSIPQSYQLLEYLWWKYPLSFLPTLLIALSQSLSKHTLSILPCILVGFTAETKPTFLATYTQSLGSLNLSCAFKNYSLLNFCLQHPLLWTLNSKNLNTYLISPFECFTGISN